MLRALIEIAFWIFIVIIARKILTSIMHGFMNAGSQPTATSGTSSQPSQPTAQLHKDPVCGTFVAESTPFHRQNSGGTFYYCSSDCKEKHALVAK